jgi:peptidyl-prolyl cis-trans isomerase A (cyclophilin A)
VSAFTPKRASLPAVPSSGMRLGAAFALVLAPAIAVPAQTGKLSDPAQLTATAPDVFRARFDTSKGAFVIEVHREWAPLGADRFYNLVRNGFYDGTRFFRVRPGFMAQFGLNGDANIQAVWQRASLRDEPPLKSNTRGSVSFTKENLPNTRFTQVFINYGDNSYLDAQGFAPFGQIVTGMDVVDKLFSPPRENEPDQRRILREGNSYLQKEFPQLDFVRKATIVPPGPTRPAAPAPRRPS